MSSKIGVNVGQLVQLVIEKSRLGHNSSQDGQDEKIKDVHEELDDSLPAGLFNHIDDVGDQHAEQVVSKHRCNASECFCDLLHFVAVNIYQGR